MKFKFRAITIFVSLILFSIGREGYSNPAGGLPSDIAKQLNVEKIASPDEEMVLKAFGLRKSSAGQTSYIHTSSPSGKPYRTNLLLYLGEKFPLQIRRKFYEMSQCGARAFQIIYTYYPDKNQTVSLIHPCDLSCAAITEKYDVSGPGTKLKATSDPVQIDTRICREYFYDKNRFRSDSNDEE